MDYNHIESFLDRVKKILFVGEIVNQAIAKTITKHIAHEVTIKMIKTKGTVIHIQGSPILHNEILVHKKEILTELGELLPDHYFTNIH